MNVGSGNNSAHGVSRELRQAEGGIDTQRAAAERRGMSGTARTNGSGTRASIIMILILFIFDFDDVDYDAAVDAD